MTINIASKLKHYDFIRTSTISHLIAVSASDPRGFAFHLLIKFNLFLVLQMALTMKFPRLFL